MLIGKKVLYRLWLTPNNKSDAKNKTITQVTSNQSESKSSGKLHLCLFTLWLCPHTTKYLWNQKWFYKFGPVIHIKPQFYITQIELFWKLWPKGIFWENSSFMVCCICLDTEFSVVTRYSLRHINQLMSHICSFMASMNAVGVLVVTLMRTLPACLFLQVSSCSDLSWGANLLIDPNKKSQPDV